MIVAAIVLLLGVAPPLPASFVPPKGWKLNVARFGENGNGENVMEASHPVSRTWTLEQEAHNAVSEMSAERTIVNSRAEPTCHGAQAGWTFEALLPLPNGTTISQIYHLAVLDGRAYSFVLTHREGDKIDPAIAHAIQSICPAAKAT